MEEKKEMWIIDTDPGCDDMVCLFYMLNKKDIDIKMISLIEGNTSINNVVINIRKILNLTKREDVPFYVGAKTILFGCNHASHVHGDDGLGNVDDLLKMEYSHIPIKEGNAAVKLVELIETYPNQINLLMIGPMTNLAIAYMLNPNILNLIKNLYTMGGSIFSRGNISPAGEFNYTYDYIAPKIILPYVKNLILIPWEPIEQHRFVHKDFVTIKEIIIKSEKKFCEKTCTITEKLFMDFTQRRGGFMMCDLYAAMCIFNPKTVKKCFLASLDAIVDCESLKGGLVVKKRINVNSYEEGLQALQKWNKPGLQLVVETMDRETIMFELPNLCYN